MGKIRIEGEIYDWDTTRLPLHEAIAMEKVSGLTLREFNQQAEDGSAFATAVMVWMVWRRNGREVKFQDIVDGTVPVDMASIGDADDDGADEAAGPGPTADGEDPAQVPSPPDATTTSAGSPSGSTSPPPSSTP